MTCTSFKNSLIVEKLNIVSLAKNYNNRSTSSLANVQSFEDPSSPEPEKHLQPIRIKIKKRSSVDFQNKNKRSSFCIYYNDSIVMKPKINQSFINLNSVSSSASIRKNNLSSHLQKENSTIIRQNIRPYTCNKSGKLIKGNVFGALFKRIF